jgi:hypothetical protein
MTQKCVNKQTTSLDLNHHNTTITTTTSASSQPTTTSHNPRSTAANHPNDNDNVATPRHQPNGQTMMDGEGDDTSRYRPSC